MSIGLKPYKPPYRCVCTAMTPSVPMSALRMPSPKTSLGWCTQLTSPNVLDVLTA